MLRLSGHVTILIVLLVLSSCTKDDPTAPVTSLGTIAVKTTPNTLNAPWSLVGPNALRINSHGDTTLTNAPSGLYTLTWKKISGWTSPAIAKRTLIPDNTLTFEGLYKEELNFVLIPPESVSMPVTYTMGSLVEPDETPHPVTMETRFYMGAGEITNADFCRMAQWAYEQGYITADNIAMHDALDGSTIELLHYYWSRGYVDFADGAFFTPFPNRPVVGITWYGAAAYCDWLSLREGLPRAYDHSDWSCNPDETSGYRLPTESEWEFACRAGTTTHFNTGDCLDSTTEANYNGSAPWSDCPTGPILGRMADVGSYTPNAWGLYDMHGNVAEWCNDLSGNDLKYSPGDGELDTWDPSRVLRGGSRRSSAQYCRSASRSSCPANILIQWFGFRVVRSVR